MFRFDLRMIWSYHSLLLSGAGYTIALTLASLLGAVVVGMVLALMRLARYRVVVVPAILYTEFFRNTPSLIHLLWIYYALPSIGVKLSAISSALVALSLSAAAYMAEVFRAGIQSVDRGQWEAAMALGFSPADLIRRVILPQALRRIIPPFVNQFVALLKNTSLVAFIAVPDLMYRVSQISSYTFRPMEFYSVAALVYLVLITPFAGLALLLERRLARSES